jgi:hypothetical protein
VRRQRRSEANQGLLAPKKLGQVDFPSDEPIGVLVRRRAHFEAFEADGGIREAYSLLAPAPLFR